MGLAHRVAHGPGGGPQARLDKLPGPDPGRQLSAISDGRGPPRCVAATLAGSRIRKLPASRWGAMVRSHAAASPVPGAAPNHAHTGIDHAGMPFASRVACGQRRRDTARRRRPDRTRRRGAGTLRRAAGRTDRGGRIRPAAGGRRDGHAARGEPQQGADQRHRTDAGIPRHPRHQGLPGHRQVHAGREHRQHRHEQHLDPRHRLDGRRRHDRHLHRRHADPDACARLQSGRGAAQVLRHRPRGGAARPAGHAVRCRLRGRHGPLHHDAAEPDEDQRLLAQRAVVHPGRRGELRGGRRLRRAGHRRHARRSRQRLVPARRRLDRPDQPGHARDRREERELGPHGAGASRGHLGAERPLERDARDLLPGPLPQRRRELLADLLEPGPGSLRQRQPDATLGA